RLTLLIILTAVTAFMAYHASKVELSYDFSRAIPINNPKYKAYQEFRKKFGEDGNLLVIAIQTDSLFSKDLFNSYSALVKSMRQIKGVDDIISIPTAIDLVRDEASEKLKAVP